MASDDMTPGICGDAKFASTQWSVVLAAGAHTDGDADAALACLCEKYWYPLYAFARRRGYGADEAQDLVQSFFARLLEKRDIRSADPQRGRFRSYLLSAFLHFASNERTRAAALKRGGLQKQLPLDFDSAEEQYRREPTDQRTPEKLYERRWVLTLLDNVLKQLAAEFERQGKSSLFESLKPFIAETRSAGYGALSEQTGMSESALRVIVHRLRRRYRDLLHDTVAGTLDDAADAEDEIRFLFSALSD